jgi:putative FmdB family regulatory protein
MPIYQYACQDCHYEFETRQNFYDQPLTECPNCHGAVQRVISSVGIIFKGTGFYVTDNKNGRGSHGNGADKKSKSSTSKKDTKAETKEKKSESVKSTS